MTKTLKRQQVKSSFFFTGNFYRNPSFRGLIRDLRRDGHYLGAHSDKHLLYCDWSVRDSLLVTRTQFLDDLRANYSEMEKFGIRKSDAPYFLPPFEWYNDTISAWTRQEGLQLINFSPGTISHADYTTPDLRNYRSSETIYQSITAYEKQNGMNGFILLVHIGTAPARTDKFYSRLEELIVYLKKEGYSFSRVDGLLE
ncbi:polysaccharide deacetylase family protein [Chryseosolibacter histidini]|uniref:polysaccharide deacetylase family protein n=1 Tax=Chryseosolibacter histidini TaxID=2782349 RepID=UPI0020B280BA|nr:polysaccharide deacetylase family protein [Chryseosolibacter histidini]